MPGHAAAAVNAMKVRYINNANAGNIDYCVSFSIKLCLCM